MVRVKVGADSSVCLPQELIEKYSIELVPEIIIFGKKVLGTRRFIENEVDKLKAEVNRINKVCKTPFGIFSG